ncbi:uncharacterized protein LOC116140609 [Pistacia vera]|uniref:uncharacterized protein LOC116140609 n=1 Tax=Pistacia vera TaxID=55513 RepID=UPI0012637F92|nr:uncharacterized protein LOC116140609 [Pistacia vera]
MSNHEVRINLAPEVELHAKKDALVTSPSQEQAVRDTADAGNDCAEEKDNSGKSPLPQDLPNNQSINEDFKKLYKAALKDEWNTAYKEVFKGDPLKNSKYLTARISEKQDTALHIAVAAESSMFVKKLVNFMQKDDLAIKNGDGNTAFFLAAESGMVGFAKIMVEKMKSYQVSVEVELRRCYQFI